MEQITFLGTGNAMVTHCYNTCFTLQNDEGILLVDAGGGNTILLHLEKAGIPITAIHHAFISHNHNDHILGFPWILRAVGQAMLNEKFQGSFTLYGHTQCLEAVKVICSYVLQPKFLNLFDKRIFFEAIDHHESKNILGHTFTFFNLESTKELQFGFKALLKSGKTLTFLGDEPYRDHLKPYAMDVDYLLHEAFCLYSQKDIFKPYEKHHATVKDACENAISLNTKTIILYHTEDKNITNRKELYTREGQTVYNGTLLVPDDLETIHLI